MDSWWFFTTSLELRESGTSPIVLQRSYLCKTLPCSTLGGARWGQLSTVGQLQMLDYPIYQRFDFLSFYGILNSEPQLNPRLRLSIRRGGGGGSMLDATTASAAPSFLAASDGPEQSHVARNSCREIITNTILGTP